MFNFCLFVFIIYAVAGSASAILFGGSRKKQVIRARSGNRGKRKPAVQTTAVRIRRANHGAAETQRKHNAVKAYAAPKSRRRRGRTSAPPIVFLKITSAAQA